MPLPAPDPTVLHPIVGQRRGVFLRPLVKSANVEVGEDTYCDSAAWWNRPIELVTDHARTIMTGTAAELDRIATEHGLRGR